MSKNMIRAVKITATIVFAVCLLIPKKTKQVQPAAEQAEHCRQNGYEQGLRVGKFEFDQGLPMRDAVDLHRINLVAARTKAHPMQEGPWVEGCTRGYKEGFMKAAQAKFDASR